ncbi:MAG: uncharacterized protein QOE92_1884 [Chloroflexota bacterium]|jgi:predicted enzyme related to lactoylglutathione lyase|nr:uncharacterized protein [Chloroflexota bacterium]
MSETTASATPASTDFKPGSPNWVDVASNDKEASKAFYTGLFGWTANDLGEEAGGYVMFELDGAAVAAMGGTQEGQPPAWSLYFDTTSADETAAKVTEAGGKVIAPPFDVLGQGRMAVFQDPTGAFFSVWQKSVMPGMGKLGEPNTFGWCELNTRDVEAAAGFYAKVFGWSAHRSQGSQDGVPYTEWQLDGKSFGGAMDMSNTPIPADVPPHWLVYFNVTDIDASTAKVPGLGGKGMMGPEAYPGGKFSVVAEPSGAAFGLMQSSEG